MKSLARVAAVLSALAWTGCGSSSPTAPSTPAAPPTASFTTSPGGVAIFSVTTVHFTATASSPSGAQLTYNWDFGDGTAATGAVASHVYSAPGGYVATLKVSDGTNTVTAQGNVAVGTISGEWASPVNGNGFDWNFVQSGRHITGTDISLRPAAFAVHGILTDPRQISFEEDDGSFSFSGTVEKGLNSMDVSFNSPDGLIEIRLVRQ